MLIARYGGKRPLLRGLYYLFAYRVGAFRTYLDIDWSRVQRLVIACHGNICRSPYAELRARELGLAATSFGLHASPGARANEAAVRNAARRGADLSGHRSRSIDTINLCIGDLLVAMEPRQAERLSQLAIGVGAQLTLQGLWALAPRPYVPDPYGRSDACFQHSYALIDSSLEHIKLMVRGSGAEQPKSRNESVCRDSKGPTSHAGAA
jgi:protein-tyrosine phosphatase